MALINILWIVLACLGAFLLGSLPFSVWLGRLATGVDLRDKNIKNPGGFNAMITFGPIIGLSITFLDLTKGALSIVLADHLFSMNYFTTSGVNYWHVITTIIVPAFCILGHNYTPFLKFKGGRGVGVFIGTLLYTNALVVTCFMIIISILIQGLKLQSRFGNILAAALTIPIAFFMPLSPPWANILLSWTAGAQPFVFFTQGLIVFLMWLAILPKHWTGIVAAITGKGGDWGFDIKKGQDLDTVHGKKDEE